MTEITIQTCTLVAAKMAAARLHPHYFPILGQAEAFRRSLMGLELRHHSLLFLQNTHQLALITLNIQQRAKCPLSVTCGFVRAIQASIPVFCAQPPIRWGPTTSPSYDHPKLPWLQRWSRLNVVGNTVEEFLRYLWVIDFSSPEANPHADFRSLFGKLANLGQDNLNVMLVRLWA
jgi:hypothetical protein